MLLLAIMSTSESNTRWSFMAVVVTLLDKTLDYRRSIPLNQQFHLCKSPRQRRIQASLESEDPSSFVTVLKSSLC